MAKIRWSHEAEQWLKEIYEYISEDNPTAAEKVVSGIYDKAQKLGDFPQPRP
ncbi:MAG: type II toxin-antitoxin system RelE/ParE family toxin [Desulfofustis sp. PB-SRB1]|nr:type II toxin-antitoxin system RelE/ParE family toxin [Desulfofustis sp. PB-SRB1]